MKALYTAFDGKKYEYYMTLLFFFVRQNVNWNQLSNAKLNLDGKYHFFIQNQELENAFSCLIML